MATLTDLQKEINEIFHELSPKERAKAMRNTMGQISREIRKIAANELKALNYEIKPRHKGELRKRKGPKSLSKNIIAVPYRRALGFHVTVTSRQARAGGHTKVDHLNRWEHWKPAARWLENGTDKQPSRPFMERAEKALDSYEHRMVEVFKEKLDDIVRKHNGR